MDQWYAAVEASTGALLSVGTVLPEEYDRKQLAFVEISGPPQLDLVRWDASSRSFVPIPPPEPADDDAPAQEG